MENVLQPYLFGGIVTLSLGFLILLIVLHRKKEKIAGQRGEFSSEASGTGDADVIIVGAGVAGAALACVLGKDGRRVHIIERNLTQPDRIVGEFLQPGGYLKLIELGLDDCVEEIDAQQVFGYAIYRDGRITKATYPSENFRLNVVARCFHNGRFIQKMREKATSLSNVHLEQGTVTSLLGENGIIKGVHYKTKLGKELQAYAPLTVVCDGCFSNLRRFLCSPKVELQSCSVGMILEDCKVPYPNFGHVIVGGPSIVLLYPISSGEVRCLVDIHGTVPSVANGEMSVYLKNVVAPQIPDELRQSFISAVDRGNIKTMPNKSMASSPSSYIGALLLGDAFNIRHPLAGGGMTVALSDIVILHDLLKPLNNLNDLLALQKQLNKFYIKRKPTACVLNVVAGIEYKLSSPSLDKDRDAMIQIFIDCLATGNANSKELMTLFSGIDIHPMAILVHATRVGIYSLSCLLFPFPAPKKLWMGARMVLVLCSIIFPIMIQERAWEMFFPTRYSI